MGGVFLFPSTGVASVGTVQLFESGIADDVDTYLTRDVLHVAVFDTDESLGAVSNIDTVQVTVYVGNGTTEGGYASGLVLDTEVFLLTERGTAATDSGVFRTDTAGISLSDTELPLAGNNRISWGRSDTLIVVYAGANTVDNASDTALALEIASTGLIQFFEDAGFTDDVDTFLTRDYLYVQAIDTDENRNPQFKDTVSVTMYVGNGTAGGGALGLVLDTETLLLTESGETTGIFRGGSVVLTDTKTPAVGDGALSWGLNDTVQAVYTDVTGTAENSYDTALALEIKSAGGPMLYEDASFSDQVDTYSTRNDVMYIAVIDTDENRNPQSKDTLTVTVYVANAVFGGGAAGLVLDTETILLTEQTETNATFLSAAIALVDTEFPLAVANGLIAAGLSDTIHVVYTDANDPTDTFYDTALIVDAPTVSLVQLIEDAAFTDEVDTYLTRDLIFVQVTDTDENRNPQSKDTVTVVVYVANATPGGGVAGLVIDTETLTLTEAGETGGVFRSAAVIASDTVVPLLGDGLLSWGLADTILVVYADINSADLTADTALALEIVTNANVQFFEDAAFTDDVDTYFQKNDLVYIAVFDTDENRNPQAIETVTATIYGSAPGGLTTDTENLVLTESGETTGIFRSSAINTVDTEPDHLSNNGRLSVGRSDTLFVIYTDANGTAETRFDTAFVDTPAATASLTQIFEDAAFTDEVDTLLTRDYMYIQVTDTDENEDGITTETVTVTVYVANGSTEGAVGEVVVPRGMILDTETLVLTEVSPAGIFFRSARVEVSDTVKPVVGDGIVSWGRSDTMRVVYNDPNSATDTSNDTALALEIATIASVTLYEDALFSDGVDTYLTQDVAYVEVIDGDENRNPNRKDTVTVTVYVGNGTTEGMPAALVLDTETVLLTESSETSGTFRSAAVALVDTQVPAAQNGKIAWGRGDTLLVTYTDVLGTSETASDTALALEIASNSLTQFFEDGAFTDEVDTLLTRDILYVQVTDTDENRNPQSKDTVVVTVTVANGTAGGGAAGLVLDTEAVVLTEAGETSGVFRSGTVVATDTQTPVIGDGKVSWGVGDTAQVVYTDVTGASETTQDTALALEIATNAVVQFYEDPAFTDDVDTYFQKNDLVFIAVFDTDENRNPQSIETVTVTVYVYESGGLIFDTENFTLTESGETTGIFRSAAIGTVDTEMENNPNNGRIGVGSRSDTLHVAYTDANSSADIRFDTASIDTPPATPSLTQIFEDPAFTDEVDTLLTRDVMYVQVTDTDRNMSGGDTETVTVKVYVGNGAAEGGSALGLILDTETLILTEASASSSLFRSVAVTVIDTKIPVVNDGLVSWGRGDTIFVIYSDPNSATDTSTDTALALEIATAARVILYEDAAFTDEIDTLLTRDVVYVAVFDTDENRNPQAKDTVTVTVYVGNGTNEGTAAQLVLDTEVVLLTESGETTGVFRSGGISLGDTELPAASNGRIVWGRGDTLLATYTDVLGTSETASDTALALEITSNSLTQFFEDGAFTDEVDTLLTRDILYVQVTDTDENRNPQSKDTVVVTVTVANGTAGGGAAGLVLDTEAVVLTEAGETSGVFRSGTVVATDTQTPVIGDGKVSWGVGDTAQVVYTDVTGASETTQDTALALEIATAATLQFYENSVYTDDVDTFVVRTDVAYIEVVDTDENRNPQSVDTITITVTVAAGGLKDTETTIVLTEAGETTGIFRSGAINIVDDDTAGQFNNNGRFGVALSDTIHATYTDANGTSETKTDTALIVNVLPSASLTEVFEDAAFTDVVDTFLTRDLMYIQVSDTDENTGGTVLDTVYVTVYVANGTGEGGYALGLILDTEIVVLTENGTSNGAFRSGAVVLSDTQTPVIGDGKVSWGRSDTLYVVYNDENDATDTSTDTALALEIATSATVTLYEDPSFLDAVDTFLTRDVGYVEVSDRDENRNPQFKDTVIVTVYVGNGMKEGTAAGLAAGLVLDTEVLILTESGETTGVFRSDASNVGVLTDTAVPAADNDRVEWGRGDTLLVSYTDVYGTSETVSDTALALEIATSSVTQIFEDAAFTDEVDTLLTRDVLYLQVTDTDENRNPQSKDTVRVTVYVSNGSSGGGAAGLVLDTEVMTITESGETTGVFRSDAIGLTDTQMPVAGDRFISWGVSDTLQVVYTDVTGTSETTQDTALALEIATAGNLQFYENSAYADDVDTFQIRSDEAYIELVDTDENRNPQAKETITITVYAANGGLKDTETIVLTESGETTGIFRSGAIGIVDSDTAGQFVNNGRLGPTATGDTFHATYTDANGTSETKSDTALTVAPAATASLTEVFEDAAFTDVVDTLLTRDVMYIQVTDSDENTGGAVLDTVYVTVYVCNGTAEGGYAAGLILDTDIVVLTENGTSNGAFRSGAVTVTDTLTPAANDGKVSWGRGDTAFVIYNDENDATDTSTDTALALEIATTARVILYEDAAFTDEVDTLLTRDVVYVAVFDTDENRNPQAKDTVTVTVYVGNGTNEGTVAGLVLDTETVLLTESGETTGVFRSGGISLGDTELPAASNGRIVWGRGDTLQATYTDVLGTSETASDTALALEITSGSLTQFFEDGGFTDEVDTLLTRDMLYVQVTDTDENRNPQSNDTVVVTLYAANATSGGGAAGLVLDTETVVLTEAGETSGVFRSGTIVATDTQTPVIGDGKVSWGVGDTAQVVYTDVTGTSETTQDTALALEIATSATVQFYENGVYTDDVDTFVVRNDVAYIEVVDTDENRNPQSIDTITITVTVAAGGLKDTETTIVLTESGETTGIFRSGAINIVDDDTAGQFNNNGRFGVAVGDTIHATYTDVNGTVETKTDTALVVNVSPSASLTEVFEDAAFTDGVDTFLTRDVMYIQVTDTDENTGGAVLDTVYVTVYVCNGTAEGGYAAGLILDTDIVVLTENGTSNGAFRSGAVTVTDTLTPSANDGKVSWGRGDTAFVIYNDENDATDTSTDTALALEIATTARVILYEDAAFTDEVDTLLTRDVVYVAVFDTDENRNPQAKDTVTVTVYVGNGTNEGTVAGLVLDTETVLLTESGETTGVFRSGGISLGDTELPAASNGRIVWGRGDTLLATYTDVLGTSETASDTALALEITSGSLTQFFEDGGFTDEVDTLLTRDMLYVQVTDTDENRNPQSNDTVVVTLYAANATSGGGAAGLVLDTEAVVLTEAGETSGVFRSGTVVATDTKTPVAGDGLISWGASDTLQVVYADVTGTGETTQDTALALEIATAGNLQFYENGVYTDDVDTFLVRNDLVYIELVDTDENRNPQSRETITIAVYVSAGGLKDTETAIVLTESGETTGIFRSGAIGIVDDDTAGQFNNNGRFGVSLSDTIHATYTDASGTIEMKTDTALVVNVSPSASLTEVFEDAAFTDGVDTFLTRDVMYIQVTDTDENTGGAVLDTVYVTVYVCNGTAEGGYAAGLILDTDIVVLTENGTSNGAFRSGAVMVTDTLTPAANDGKVSWGRGDTAFVIYNDENDATDTSTDTAGALEIATSAQVILYEDAAFTDEVDTLLTRDVVYVAVVDTDENRNPQAKDTVTVTVYVGNGTNEGTVAGLVLDTETVLLTESGETTGVFRSGGISLGDTELPAASNGRIVWGRGDTLQATYTDVLGTSETASDTALALEITSNSLTQFFEEWTFTDEVDTFLTRDMLFVQVTDTDENRNPQSKDTVLVSVTVANGTAGGGAAGLVLDTETLTLTESGETTGIFRVSTDGIVMTDTKIPAANDGVVSWGVSDTLHVTYSDITGTNETASDTALALEIASAAVVQLYEENTYTDDVDTYIINNDMAYIQVVDTDENRNPQARETIAITVYVGNASTVNDTESFILTESGETTGIFRSGAITITKSDAAGLTNNNGKIRGQTNDTVHAAYTDANGTTELRSDTALLLGVPSFVDNGSVTVYISNLGDSSEPSFDSTTSAFGGLMEAMAALNPANGFDTVVVFVSTQDSYSIPSIGISVDTGVTIISRKALTGSDNGNGGDTLPTVAWGGGAGVMFTVDSGARFEGFAVNGVDSSSGFKIVQVNASGASPNRAVFTSITVRNAGYGVHAGSNANNLEIISCTALNLSRSAVEFSGVGARIEKCYAENIADSAISQSGGSGATIVDNVIRNANAGIILNGGSNAVLRNNIFNITAQGVRSNASNNIFHANEIHTADTGVEIAGGASGNEVRWNNIYSCTTFIKDASSGHIITRNYFGLTDISTIAGRIVSSFDNFAPYRFARIDTRVSGDSIATDVPDTVALDTGAVNQITVRWQTPGRDEDGSAAGAVSYYKVLRLKDSVDTTNWITLTPLSDTSATDTFLVDANVIFGSTYYYRVVAVKSTGETSWMSDTKTAKAVFSGPGVIRFLTPGGVAASAYKARSMESVVIEVNDSDPNKNPAAREDTVVTLVNLTLGTDTEVITITEAGVNSAIFTGTAALSINISDSAANSGLLFVRGGDVIKVIYRDVSSTADRSASLTIEAGGIGADSMVDVINDPDTFIGSAGSALTQAFVVAVYDTAGDSVQGVSVTWEVSLNGGSFYVGGGSSAGGSSISSSSTSDAQGKASATLTLGSANGFYMVRATAPRSGGGTIQQIFVAYTDKRDIPLSTDASVTWTMFSPYAKPVTSSTGRNQLSVSAGSVNDLVAYWYDPTGASSGSFGQYRSVTGQASPNASTKGEFTSFEAGRSYWIMTKTSARGVGLASGSTPSDSPHQVIVYTGWNMIANPYPYFIDWRMDVRIDTTPNSNTNDTVAYLLRNVDTTSGNSMHGKIYWREGSSYAFGPSGISNLSNEGSWTSYDTTVLMKPLAGYWMKIFGECSSGCSLVYHPNVRVPSSSKAKAAAPSYNGATGGAVSDWSMNLKASGQGLSDDYTYVGVAPGAKEGYDEYSAFKAPPMGDFVQVAVREGKDAQSPAYAASLIPQITTAATWDVVVSGFVGANGSSPLPVTVSWDASGLPAGYGAYLLGGPAGPVDMTKSSSAAVVLASSVNLQLAVGLPEYLAAFLAAPLSKEQTFAYPNPGPDANGNVSFNYNLSAAGDVKLKIYDVGGKLVKELTASGIASVTNTITWDGTNRNGQKVGSGVYIYIIEGAGNKLIDKLAIVR